MLNYKIHGEQNAETLLFIHGALVSQSMWDGQINAFAENHRVITCDLPEHGASLRQLEDYSVETLAHQVKRMLDHLGVTKTHICGHSLGGMVAQQLAILHPELTDKLILAETAFGTANNLKEKSLSFISKIFLKLMSKDMLIKLSVSNYGKLRDYTAEYVAVEMGKYPAKQMLRVMVAAMAYSGKNRLHEIHCPTLILVGAHNKITHKQAREMGGLIPNSAVESVARAHHFLNLDNELEFNRQIVEFLKT